MSQLGNDHRTSQRTDQRTDQREDVTGARRHIGVATMEATVAHPSAMGSVLGAPTSHLDISGHLVYSAHPTPTDSLPIAAARDAMQTLALLDAVTTGRVLIIEPFTDSLIRTMRQMGFTGECVSWVRTPRDSADGWSSDSLTPLEQSDQVFVGDWLDAEPIADGPLVAPNRDALANPEGRFQLIVALELTRLLPLARHAAFLQYLTTLLAPLGFLVVGGPADSTAHDELATTLTYEGLALTADARRLNTDWDWRLTRWQLRSGRATRRTGSLEAITYAQIATKPRVQDAVVSAYREVFGGDEWSEWMFCPVCNRQYSRREYANLIPPDRCVCGAHAPLALFHSVEDVLLQAKSDLADAQRSRLYARWGQESARLDAFIWGYLTDPHELAQTLLPRQGVSEQVKFRQSLAAYCAGVGVTDPTSPIYHQAFIGALEKTRNFGVVRAMFTRVCQFAIDQHAPIMVTATIPSVNAFPLLLGIGMEVIYTYPAPAEMAIDPEAPDVHNSKAAENAVLRYSHLDEQGVILAGTAWSILSAITRASDRGLEVLVARTLRQMRTA